MTLLLLILLAPAPQEDVEALVRRLSDDSIEERGSAEERLLRIGEPARAAHEKASGTDDAELKARIARLLKTLDLYKELRGWLAPPTRITLSGEMTLQEAVEEVERRSGQKVKCASWPEGRFNVDLKDVPYWEALETLCARSGTRTLFARASGPEIGGSAYVKVPSSTSGGFCVRFERFSETRRFSVAGASENRSMSLNLSLGWERSIAPARTYMALEEVADDAGGQHLRAIQEYESRSFGGGAWYVQDPPPAFMQPLHAGAFSVPAERAKRLTSVRGRVLVWIRAASEDVEVPVPAPGEEARVAVKICDDRLIEASEMTVSLSKCQRSGGSLSCWLSFKNVDPRMVRDTWQMWHLKDDKGRRYPGQTREYPIDPDPRTKSYGLHFDGIPAEAAASSLSVRIPKKVVAIEIPFDLRDLPIR